VAWIGLRPERLAQVVAVDGAVISPSGLVGDHGRAGKRALTLIQAEHLPVIAGLAGGVEVTPADLRRNIMVSGINLTGLRHRKVRLGSSVIELTTVCAPCSRMEAVLGHGGYNAMRGHGGWCATVVEPGEVAVGDVVDFLDG
jgi:MOSC domain-containing protein YiiM